MSARSNNLSDSLKALEESLKREVRPASIPFSEFLGVMADQPELSLRSIFQLIHDMMHHYIPDGTNEYPNDPESINYIHYDCSKFFVDGAEAPFLADRLLANHLMNVVHSLQQGVIHNKMLVFVGPPGSGKSTFLNRFIDKLEEYTALDCGAVYETVWHIDTEKLGLPYIPNVLEQEVGVNTISEEIRNEMGRITENVLIIPCPSHDHPLMQIPVQYRARLLDDILEEGEFKDNLFTQKEFSWVFEETPCPICSSIYRALAEKLTPEEVLSMLYVRRYEFSRKLGEGVSVFNPGDEVYKKPLDNPELQKWLDAVFKSSSAVSYLYSRMAKTNNGVFAIMDAKSNNIDRLKNIHGIISDGIHKVASYEETINSLFMALINPEDSEVIDKEKSFRDRVIHIPIPYIRDYTTEVQIYRNIYSSDVEKQCLPRILDYFARAIVASRLEPTTKSVKEWIQDKYKDICDENLFMIQMEIYSGKIPPWLTEKDVKGLDRNRRHRIISEGEEQGRKGFSGRDSIAMFSNFVFRYRHRADLINIENVIEFFHDRQHYEKLPKGFLTALHNLYDYSVLQELKEAMFYYNRTQISRDIKNYLFAVNNEMDSEVECPYTGTKLSITEEFFKTIESRLLSPEVDDAARHQFRNDVLKHYVARTLHVVKSGEKVQNTDQYKDLLARYNQNVKQNVLAPFISNENFRRAIKDYGDDEAFKNYDRRIQNEVKLLMKNLKKKFGYSEAGASQVCIYVLDKNLAEKFV